MVLVGAERLRQFGTVHRTAARALTAWAAVVVAAAWKSPVDVLRTLGTADPNVRVASGRRVAVFNVRGKRFRVVAAIDYGMGIVQVLRVMTHAEYSRDAWKDQL